MTQEFFSPLTGNQIPRFAGVATMMRLPQLSDPAGLDAAFIGVPLDCGTSYRSGTRHGPRQIRSESSFVRHFNVATGAAPFESLRIADLGDLAISPYSVTDAHEDIYRGARHLFQSGCIPMALGGDHSLTYAIIRAAAEKHGPVGLIHIDAHSDTLEHQFGQRMAHGCPMRRVLEDGLVDPRRMVQVGLRGSGYGTDDYDWQRELGVWVVPAERCWNRSLAPLAAAIVRHMKKGPVYLSYDIDSLDPAHAPGTGTIEPGGLTLAQALELIRGLRGLDLVGFDLVEVSPPLDPFGTTALMAANLILEMLCVLPGVQYRSARDPLSFRDDLPPEWV